MSSSNKFLEKYPALREPQVGDIIEITEEIKPYCNLGARGVITMRNKLFPNFYVVNIRNPLITTPMYCWIHIKNMKVITHHE